MKPRFFMTVGIAGSGKSTWAKENLNKENMFEKIYSTDEYRAELLGDINDQNHNDIIFKAIYKDMINALKEGENICFDATNLTRKGRSRILNLIKQHNIECEKIAVLFEVEFSIILKQIEKRERKVPIPVLYRMRNKFEIPFIGEGFDRIDTIFKKDLSNKHLTLADIHSLMNHFDQNNPHHSNDLLEHCIQCFGNLENNNPYLNNFELKIASLIHDFGKLYTKTFDIEKGYSHFIGHENYGAYESLFIDYEPFVIDKEKIAFYINYHMVPYGLQNAKKETLEKYKHLFGDEWNNIMLLHDADSKAH